MVVAELTLTEYLVDYASPEPRTAGMQLIQQELEQLPEGDRKQQLLDRLKAIRETDERDLYF